MEISAANSLIQVVAEHNHVYPDQMRRELLEGIYEIAEASLQTLDAREDAAVYKDSRNEITIAMELIESALLAGELTGGFLVALDCFNKASSRTDRSF